MQHVLDNPAWNALISGSNNLANGKNAVKYFDKEVSPFAGLEENSTENFKVLYDMLPHDRPVLFVTPTKIEIPGFWNTLRAISGFQMVYEGKPEFPAVTTELVPLTTKHVPQMLELTKLTNPGPFAERTIEFGHYHGIFDGDKLVAMTGQRLHVFNYAEVSAVCTHPDYTGRGYARQLLIHQINRIKAASEAPFLHVRNDNERAIKVYEDLGFSTRTDIHFYVLAKNK